MHLFRNMQEPESTDITQYPGYIKLSGDEQKKVAETYTNVYNNNQGKLGFKVAQGIAFETAKKMCESFVVEKDYIGNAASNKKYQSEGEFDATRDASPGTIADEAGDGTVDKTISKPGPTYEDQKAKFKCSEKRCDISAYEHKHAGDKIYKPTYPGYKDIDRLKQATMPQAHKTPKVGMTEDEINEFAVSQTGKRFVMKDGVKHKVIGVRDGQLVTEPVRTKKKVTEGEAEEFQAANDNLVGMTEAGFEGLISAANPEEDGAARQLRLNHDKMCLGCGSVHPLDVMCFDGRTHSEAGAPGGGNGAADILKQNHAQKGMKGMGEQTDPLISAVASYLTNRAKISGLMESLEEGAGDIQKKNLENKCPNCGSLKKDEKCPKCDSDQEPSDKKADDDSEDSEEILKKNHKEKGESLGKDVDEAELDEKHIGFKALQGKLERSGHSKESAGAIAASIGAKKYGKAAMHKAAASHTPLGEDEDIQEALDEIWDENFYPAKPLEESCGNCSHPKSYHMKACQTCNECTGFVAENTLEEKHKKDQICFCGHEFGGHSKGGCKVCKHEGVVKPERAAHQFKKNDWSEKFESDYAKIFAAQQGKINTTFANARLNWLPEEAELDEAPKWVVHPDADEVKKKYGKKADAHCKSVSKAAWKATDKAKASGADKDHYAAVVAHARAQRAHGPGTIANDHWYQRMVHAHSIKDPKWMKEEWLPEEFGLTEGKGYEDIGPGDHVVINHPLRGSDKVPQQGKGKIVMKGPAGWVLNMGGKYGTPGIATRDNYVSHRKAKKKMTEDEMIETMFVVKESDEPATDSLARGAGDRAAALRQKKSTPSVASKKAWAASKKARDSQSEDDHRAAEKAHREASLIHAKTHSGSSSSRAHSDQADVHKYLADFTKRYGGEWTKHQPQTSAGRMRMGESETKGHEGKGHPEIIKHGYKKTNKQNGIDDSSGVGGKKPSGALAALVYGPGGKKVHEEEIQEENNYPDYHEVLNKHGYKSKGADDEGHRYEHPNGSHVMLHASGWTHKGKNKKLVGNTGDSPKSLDSHLKGVARAQRAGEARKDRDATMKSLGLNKVKGSVSGKTYWESEEDPTSHDPTESPDYVTHEDRFDPPAVKKSKKPKKSIEDRFVHDYASGKVEIEAEEMNESKGHSVTEEVDPLMSAALGYIDSEIARAGGPINEENAVHQELAAHLKRNHGKNQHGCLTTEYSKIPGLKVHASDTNGRCGIGTYKGHGVYWSHHHPTGEFKIEPHTRW